jgi:thioredoxin reductase (NADPH)
MERLLERVVICLDDPRQPGTADAVTRYRRGTTISAPATQWGSGRSMARSDFKLLGGKSVTGRALVIAPGVRYRSLPVDGLAKVEGTSVHHVATESEAQLCRGTPVVAVGDHSC